MSLTLRDAQHLSYKTVKKFEKIDQTQAAKLGSEANLIKKAKEIADKLNTLKETDTSVAKNELAKLLSEHLFTLFVVAEHYGLNLEESFLQTVDELILGFVS